MVTNVYLYVYFLLNIVLILMTFSVNKGWGGEEVITINDISIYGGMPYHFKPSEKNIRWKWDEIYNKSTQ